MEIVIKIPEEDYKYLIREDNFDGLYLTYYEKLIVNGTPLPKEHGDLIDKDRLLDELEKTVKSVDDTKKHLLSWDRAVAHVHLSKPIIAADGGEEDG